MAGFDARGQNQWTWRNPLPEGNALNAVICAGGTFAAAGNAGTFLTSNDGETWTKQGVGTSSDLYAIAQGGGVFVSVGANGAVTRSTNTVNWTLGNSGTSEPLRGVVFGNELFVAVGGSSRTGIILTSRDGIVWTNRASGIDRGFNSVAYGNGRFVAVGANDLIYTSPDGLSWTAVTPSGNSNSLNTVTFGNGVFVAGGFYGALLTSQNGVTWTTRTSNTNQTITCFSYGGGRFRGAVADGSAIISSDGMNWLSQLSPVGSRSALQGTATDETTGLSVFVGKTGTILTTPDMVSWTVQGSPAVQPRALTRGNGIYVGTNGYFTATATTPSRWSFHRQSTPYLDVAFGNGLFVGITGTAIHTSTDGINWTNRFTGLNQSVTLGHSIKFSGGRFIVTAMGKIVTSVDGLSWTASSVGVLLMGGTFANGTYVAVGGASNVNEIYTSMDGVTWITRTSSATSGFTDVAFGNGVFVAVGHSGKIFTSPDGITWTGRATGVSSSFRSVASGKGIFVVSGSTGLLLTSSDGITWSNRSLPTSTDLDVNFDGTEFFSGGDRIVTSPDGINWTFRTPPPDEDFQDVTYGNGLFVGITRWTNSIVGSTILTSTDGETWTAQTTFPFWLTGVAFANGLYFAGGENGKLLTSTDGIHWAERVSKGTRALRHFAYGSGLFVAVGGSYGSGELLTSPDGINWNVRTPATADGELYDIIFVNGLFVAVGGSNGTRTLITSPDGINWTGRTMITAGIPNQPLLGISYGDGTFVTVGAYGLIAKSSNGIDWSPQIPEDSFYGIELSDVVFADGVFVAVRRYTGDVLSSRDGTNWLRHGFINAEGLAAICYGSGKLVTVGASTAILTSPIESLPPAPFDLAANPASSRGVVLTWQDTSGEAGYRIERRIEPSGPWSEVASSLPANSTVFEDSNLTPGATYSYRIRTVYSTSTSFYSGTTSVRTFTVSEQWRQDHFQTISDTDFAADTADPDGDGVKNLLERAFALNPSHSTQGGLPETFLSGGRLRIEFARDSANTDLVYEVEVSDDLQTWTTIARSSKGKSCTSIGAGVDSIYEDALGGTRYRVMVSVRSNARPCRFLRLEVIRE